MVDKRGSVHQPIRAAAFLAKLSMVEKVNNIGKISPVWKCRRFASVGGYGSLV